jgi:hypothetical protein
VAIRRTNIGQNRCEPNLRNDPIQAQVLESSPSSPT